MARMYVPKGMTLSMDVLPTPPSSPDEGEDDGGALERVAADAEEKSVKKKEEEFTLKEWLSKSPVYLNLQSALSELRYRRLKSSPHKNSCLLFSYFLCTYTIAESEQETRYSAIVLASL